MGNSEVGYQKTEWHRVYVFYVFFEVALGVFLAVLGFVDLGKETEESEWLLALSALFLLGAAVLFCIGARLEIRMAGKNLEATLGLGWKNKTIPLGAIESVKKVEIPFIERKNRKDAWFCGSMALQVISNDDEVFWLGTSEPDVLASVLMKARPGITLESTEPSGSN